MHISEDHLQGHGHSHDDLQPMSREEILKLLGYMLDHNRHHTDELHGIFHALDDAGCYDAADELENAMRSYRAGNEALENALDLARQCEEAKKE